MCTVLQWREMNTIMHALQRKESCIFSTCRCRIIFIVCWYLKIFPKVMLIPNKRMIDKNPEQETDHLSQISIVLCLQSFASWCRTRNLWIFGSNNYGNQLFQTGFIIFVCYIGWYAVENKNLFKMFPGIFPSSRHSHTRYSLAPIYARLYSV